MSVDLEQIGRRAEAATPGPWEHSDSDFPVVDWADGPLCSMDEGTHEDADFIAHAREDIPALLAAIDELTARNAKLEAVAEAASVLEFECYPQPEDGEDETSPIRCGVHYDPWPCEFENLRAALDALGVEQ